MANVPYIRYGGNLIFRQPYDLQQVRACGFVLEGNREKMQAMVDKTLNIGGETRYHVVTSTLFLTFMDVGYLRSASPGDSQKGSYRETELNIQMLLAGRMRGAKLFIPDRAVWYMPYLWTDSAPSMIAGREVYGFPKQLGSIRMPAGVGQSAEFQVDTEVIHPFVPETRSRTAPLVSARRTDAPALEFVNVWPTLQHAAAEAIEKVLSLEQLGNAIAGEFLGDLPVSHLLNLAFLRQFPSIADGSQACYQSVAEAPFEITEFRGAGRLKGDYEVNIFGYDSCPVAKELGIATDQNGNVHARTRLGYHYDLDFRLLNGTELWVG